METLISSSYLGSISWTGRGKGKERKASLSTFKHIMNLITVIVMKADCTYCPSQIQKSITYDILKRAPLKYGNASKKLPSAPSTSSTSSELSQT